MRLLLDTHVFLWCVNDDRRLTQAARGLLSGAAEIYVSSASIWEAAIKAKLGKLDVDVDALVTSIADSGFLELPVTAKHAAATGKLPDVHSDPFDRLLIAQAISEPLRFLTADRVLCPYSDLVELV
jgi:PIN domain nuclease of toxin-antitoxin system